MGMNLEVELDVQHKLLKVAWSDVVVDQCLNYFKRFPENEGWFIEELNELCWRNKYIGSYRNHISLTAVPLANKIYEQLGLITFPFIQRVASRGWDTSGGTWAWSMKTVSGGICVNDIGSCDPVEYLLRKTVKLYASESWGNFVGNGEIGGEVSK
jgi:hypothetical protein